MRHVNCPGRGGGGGSAIRRGGCEQLKRSRGAIREDGEGAEGAQPLEKVGGSDIRVTDSCHYFYPDRRGYAERCGIML